MTPEASSSLPVLLVVDDTRDNLALLHSLFRDRYRLLMATDAFKALRILESGDIPDLILLDVMMPDIDGFSLCRKLKENLKLRDVPVIFLTALSDPADEKQGFEAGGVDFVTKPINLEILMSRVKTHLELKKSRDLLKGQSAFLQTEVLRRTRELGAMQEATILAMASLAELRDDDTGGHIWRTQGFVRRLACALLDHPDFVGRLDEETVALLVKAAPLHDLGKIGIRDEVLRKPGRLDAEEFEHVKTHARAGWAALDVARKHLGGSNPLVDMAAEIALRHHEKWDGSGYPDGLAGEAIPIPARIMALADVYDALTSRRVYKEPVSHEKAMTIIQEGSGSHFDPRMVDVFIAIGEDIREITRGALESGGRCNL